MMTMKDEDGLLEQLIQKEREARARPNGNNDNNPTSERTWTALKDYVFHNF